jgi:acyl dehydratase
MMSEQVFTQENYNDFANLSGDFNPIHVDALFSANSGFGKTVAHGIYLVTCLSGALQKEIGDFTILNSRIMFPAPTFTNVEMEFDVQILGENLAKLICREKQSRQETCVIDIEYCLGFLPNIALKSPENSIIIDNNINIIKPFVIGQDCQQIRVFSPNDIAKFCELGGHKSAINAVSPILINAMFSKILGIDLPGLGTNYLKQETKYIAAPLIGEKISAKVTITRIREDKKIIDFSTQAFGEDNRLIADGRALVSARDVKGAFIS